MLLAAAIDPHLVFEGSLPGTVTISGDKGSLRHAWQPAQQDYNRLAEDKVTATLTISRAELAARYLSLALHQCPF